MLAFDVFGTVVDWHGGVTAEVASVAAARGIVGDWSAFALAWRAGYAPAMERVRSGSLPWTHIDALHRLILDDIVDAHGLGSLDSSALDQLNRVWHRLPPWPDTVPSLERLRRGHLLTTLSNGNFSLLTNLAKHGGLPWDCIVSAELFGHYKPDPEVYLGCAGLLQVSAGELMLVACHANDLRAARACGLRTAYVRRPREAGVAGPQEAVAPNEFDLITDDFHDLANQLGA